MCIPKEKAHRFAAGLVCSRIDSESLREGPPRHVVMMEVGRHEF